jgi:conjugal transfer pilus assembly protein TraK
MKRLMLLGWLAWSGLAYAQDQANGNEDSAGERPIARSLGEQAVGSRFEGVPGLAPNTGDVDVSVEQPVEPSPSAKSEPPRGTDGTASTPAQFSKPITASRPSSTLAGVDVKPPPAEIVAKPGHNYVFAIAKDHLNRLVTPFADPMIKTMSSESITTDKGIVYVAATQSSAPIAMFVYDRQDPETALSLTLVPMAMPPVATRISIEGYAAAERFGTPRAVEAAQATESNSDYVSTLSSIMSEIALGRLPDGYGLMPVNGYPALMPECLWSGVNVTPRQVLSGSSYTVFVALVESEQPREVELPESACDEPQVRAVSLWPDNTLGPGEKAELYVVVSAEQEVAPESQRPSLIGGGW